jgi:uncharacterized protein (TIGR03118 family)
MKAFKQNTFRLILVAAAAMAVAASAQRVLADGVNNFTQTNLVSDIPGLAKTTDPDLVNPWGVSFSATSPFWVSDNGTGVATLYNGNGDKQGLTVTIPAGASGMGAPTGVVFNSSTSFNSDVFIFATENGTIDGWRGGLGTTAELLDTPSVGAVYKGLAIGSTASGTYLYATDFHNNLITVIPGVGAPALPGNFTDPNMPAGYAPFNIENINGLLYVTYAVPDAAGHDPLAGPGNGFVDVFNLQGVFLQRLVTGGPLNSPWGMALAPAGFGEFANDLLIGNFGDGKINAFNPSNGSFVGTLDGTNGMPLVNLGLWDLTFGNGGNGGHTSDLYFTAGIPGTGNVEDHGLFASIAETPEPGTLMLIGTGLLGLLAYGRRRIGAIA